MSGVNSTGSGESAIKGSVNRKVEGVEVESESIRVP